MNPERKPPTPATLEEVQQAPQGSIIRASDSTVLAIRIDNSTSPWGEPGRLDDGVVAWATDEDAHTEMILERGAVLVLPADMVPAAEVGELADATEPQHPLDEWLAMDADERQERIDGMTVRKLRELVAMIADERQGLAASADHAHRRARALSSLAGNIGAAAAID